MRSNIGTQIQNPYGDYTLRDLLDLHTKEVMLQTNCHAIGTIKSFDASNQTAQATINYQKTIYFQDPVTGVFQSQYLNYAPASGPVIILGGGGGHLTFPISSGDSCLILFNDRDFDTWFQSQAGQPAVPVPTARMHSFSDAIILVGINNIASAISSYDNQRALLSYNGAEVGVGNSSKVKIANQSYTLNGLLQSILTQLETLANTAAVSGSPLNPSVATQLSTLATELGALLE